MSRSTATRADAPAARAAGPGIEHDLEEHRAALTAHCSRILGSPCEAEDAVQETLVRAWRKIDGFEGRASLRTWLHSIATNVCLDMRDAKQRRAPPIDPASAQALGASARQCREWIQPARGAHAQPTNDDPAERAVTSEAIRQAFVAALLHLPPQQRSVLILREVLRWRATEVAELLGTTVGAVNSALQRARSNLAAGRAGADGPRPLHDDQRALLKGYLDAFQRYDVDAFVSLLR
jgi:RNA polymerase sigma-70 factor, ECF subfamily